jgi:hypothetical protein
VHPPVVDLAVNDLAVVELFVLELLVVVSRAVRRARQFL